MTKCENFRYRGNKGQSGTNLDNVTKLADPENPQFCTRVWQVSPIEAELFVLKYSSFSCRVNRGRSGTTLNDNIKLSDPENPSFAQESRTYLL